MSAEYLKRLAKEIKELRYKFLFGDDAGDESSWDPLSEQHFCLALSALEQARHYMNIAALYQASVSSK